MIGFEQIKLDYKVLQCVQKDVVSNSFLSKEESEMHSFKDVSFLQFDNSILDFRWKKQSSKSILQQCHTKNTHKGEAMEGGRWTTHSIFLLNELWNEKIFSKLNLGSASIYLVNNNTRAAVLPTMKIWLNKMTLKSHFQSQKLSILLLSDSQENCPWYRIWQFSQYIWNVW